MPISTETIDQIRNMRDPQGMWATADMLILIAGMIVPGKYIGGTPISVKEASHFFCFLFDSDFVSSLMRLIWHAGTPDGIKGFLSDHPKPP